MGVYHYYLEAIPQSFANKHLNDIANILDEQAAWENEKPSLELLNELRNLLPNNTSWGEVEEYKSNNEWGSDLRIWKEDGEVSSIQFRYSPYADPEYLLEAFVNAIANAKYLLFTGESNIIIQPVMLFILEDMNKSLAYKFISNPIKTIIESAESINNEISKRILNNEEKYNNE